MALYAFITVTISLKHMVIQYFQINKEQHTSKSIRSSKTNRIQIKRSF